MAGKEITVREKEVKLYTRGEERFNWITHLVGIVIAVAGLITVTLKAARTDDAFSIVSAAVYGTTMIVLYSGSTLYHLLPPSPAKRRARILDHCSIFILIAGTYTPYTLITLRKAVPVLGWLTFGLVWGGGLAGIILNIIDLKRFAKASMACYIALGWCALLSMYYLIVNILPMGLVLLIGGGVLYTVGAVFYAKGKKRKYIHSVWHLFVLAGTITQFFSIFFYVL